MELIILTIEKLAIVGVGDFEEKRKNHQGKVFVIAQREMHILPRKENKINLLERFNYLKHDYIISGYGKKVNNIYLQDRNSNGKEAKVNAYGMTEKIYCDENISDCLDKSGYLLINRRIELKRKAQALKNQRDKAKALEFDCMPYLDEMNKRIKEAKNVINIVLYEAQTTESVNDLEKMTRCLYWVIYEMNKFEKLYQNKIFSSIEQINDIYNGLNNKVHEIKSVGVNYIK